MLNITKTVLRRPVAVIVLIAGMLIFGISSIVSMPLKLIPDMQMPMLLVQIIYPQAGPEEVERLVSKEIEGECGTISGLDSITSYSRENVSMVLLQFEYGTDLDESYTDVQSAVNRAKSNMPDSIRDPIIMEMDVNAQPVITLAVNSLSGDDVSSYVTDVFQPELEKISTVAQVEVAGGDESYISIQLIPEKLTQYGLSINSIASAVSGANSILPAGTKEYGNYNIDITTKTEFKTPEEIATIPITTATGNIIHLSDVAVVSYAMKEGSSLSRYNGASNVSVSITKEQSASAVTVSRDVQKAIDRLKEKYPDYEVIIQYDSADAILSSIKSIFETLVFGVLITMFVLFLFFGDFKGSLIVGSSMPVSLLITFMLMSFMGYSLNIVTMGALVIAIGMMVDNSIVVIEMCFREKEKYSDYGDAAFEACKVVMNSVIASTITTIVVYVPLSVMKGLVGQIFGQLGFTIVFALLASLVSAVTVVPLCFKYYKPVEKSDAPINHLLEKISNWYKKVIAKFLHKKKLTAVAAIIIFGVSIYLIQFVHSELMPATDEGRVNIDVTFRPGTKKEVVDEKIVQLETFVASFDYIEGYSATSRTASGSVSAYIDGDSKKTTNEVVDAWIDDVMSYADNCEISISSSSETMMIGGSNTYDITYESTDLNLLKDTVNEISDIMMSVNGVSSVSSSLGNVSTKAEIHVDPIKAAANGLTPQLVGGTIYSATNGTDAFDVSIDNKDYKVKIEYPKDEYKTVNDIYGMTLTNMQGMSVPLRDIAEIVYTDAPQTIMRTDGRYTVTLTASMKSSEKFEAQEMIEEKLNAYNPPANVYKSESMMNKIMTEEFTALGFAIATAIILVYMVMAIEFENLIYSGLVMFCIPFAIIGSIVFLLVTGQTFSMTSLLGFMMLAGIVVNNGILFVDYTNQLRDDGMPTEEALVETGASRLRPILMTTLTTIISMLPFTLGIGKNTETMQGMALVISGGLIASTILTLIMLPVFYLVIDNMSNSSKNRRQKRQIKKAEKLELKLNKSEIKTEEGKEVNNSEDSDNIEIVDIDDLNK
ncbi:MAG: efflux RND transporter permease subunit [Lachnospiraceae bacterium]|nr:efflux RND transporter permease subunit [Lachnospiraceae bacterium]